MTEEEAAIIILADYYHYLELGSFMIGRKDYTRGQTRSPYNPNTHDAIAWQAGVEAQMRIDQAVRAEKLPF